MNQLPTDPVPLGRRQVQHRLRVYLLTGTILIAGTILFLGNPAHGGIFPPSPFRALTGLYCPGCGTLRALHQLLHGNFWAALDLNPLMILALPYLVYSYCCYAAPVIIRRKLPRLFLKPHWINWILKLVLAYWVLRNIPLWPFTWLAP
ncbi:DUF2752 domain-containing protein [Lyngbya confervoides]|uniref:DUF2752 domain-containing protein n=1 Tax=Lyngbya confervoides BDU141951 TaxID=1574623 RepID=A0ABD4T9K9_9CYAN|nr:DUF2752 domain-containing protein [Lyngbya confervoides]MCM1985153.1 DUF2752 domain-containing protein [Lyngbya confervoides BDU141951]